MLATSDQHDVTLDHKGLNRVLCYAHFIRCGNLEIYSNVKTRSSPSNLMPKLISRLLILPALGACTTISIFMADSTTNGAPFSTVSPTFTLISQLTVHFEKYLTFAIFREILCNCQSFDTESFALLNCDIEYLAYFRPREKNSGLQFIYRTKLFLEVQIILCYFRLNRILQYRDIIYFENLYKSTDYNHESRMVAPLSLFRINRTNAIAVNVLVSLGACILLDVLDIPRPPPPYAALKITGRPCFMQNSIASSELVTGPSVPGTIGTPA
ncbi:hypothetical protein ALC62_05079 [Cyphomyrmex costatus]|uniref:Uncharacterized protein n=1 Tax=Cyphomyrmex costatus TaxID=456900 RepID=A0A195CUF5_9HYME|nr:hypothetical protein ALC62_05079 [Cyphomyrmex costatus]